MSERITSPKCIFTFKKIVQGTSSNIQKMRTNKYPVHNLKKKYFISYIYCTIEVLLTIFFIILNHLGHYLFYAACNNIVSYLVDRCFGVGIDRDDDTALLHTSNVLNSTANAASNVHFGACSQKPASTAARLAPTSPCSSCANLRRRSKPSFEPTP